MSRSFRGLSMILRTLPLLAVLLVLSACGGAEQGAPGHTFTVTRSDGVETTVNSAVPRYEVELFTYEEIAHVQEGEGEESLLSRPGMAVLDEEGAFYIVDRAGRESRIAVFDQTGEYLRSLGGSGDGPGEFRTPEIMRADGGLLLVLDRSQNRLQRFRTDGTLVDVLQLPEAPSRIRWQSAMPAEGGRWVVGERVVPILAPGSTDLSERAGATVFSSAWDSVTTVWSRSIPGGKMISIQTGNMVVSGMAMRPFNPVPSVSFSPELGLIVTDGEQPILQQYGLDGVLKRQIRIEFEPRPVTAEDRAGIEDPLRERLEGADERGRAMIQAQLENLTYPETKAYWGEAGSGWRQADRGFLWIRVNRTNEPPDWPETTTRFMVLSPEGEFLGYTTLPTHRRGMASVRAGRLVTGQIDEETGAVGFRSWRIVPTVEGLDYP